jgi:hypothetical protein
MKKITIIGLLSLSAVLAGCDSGSVFNAEQMHTDATTRIESAGWDMRVYEFTPRTAPNMQCVFVAGNRKGGLTCFNREL